ncbi:MAG: LytTR family DNA-binding domain-containing protein [Bacteroidota bacterium]
MIRKLPVLLFLAAIIAFDAFQQRYYLDTFNLHPEGTRVSILDLMRSHATRWAVYALVHFPLFVLLYRKLREAIIPRGHLFTRIFLVLMVGLVTTLLAISILNISQAGLEFSMASVAHNFLFFFFQKGLAFFMVSAGLVLLMVSIAQKRELLEKHIVIRDLTMEKGRLKDALRGEKDAELHLKVGSREHVIALARIVWIQSDDYCVKVHTESRSYTIRKSLGKLAEELAPYGFVRVHRSAIFNTNYLDYIDYQHSLIKLTNDASVPFSKSGIKALKHTLESVSNH